MSSETWTVCCCKTQQHWQSGAYAPSLPRLDPHKLFLVYLQCTPQHRLRRQWLLEPRQDGEKPVAWEPSRRADSDALHRSSVYEHHKQTACYKFTGLNFLTLPAACLQRREQVFADMQPTARSHASRLAHPIAHSTCQSLYCDTASRKTCFGYGSTGTAGIGSTCARVPARDAGHKSDSRACWWTELMVIRTKRHTATLRCFVSYIVQQPSACKLAGMEGRLGNMPPSPTSSTNISA